MVNNVHANIIFVSIQQQKDIPPAKSKRIKVLTMEEDIDKGSVNSEDRLLQKVDVGKDHLLQKAGRENREGN